LCRGIHCVGECTVRECKWLVLAAKTMQYMYCYTLGYGNNFTTYRAKNISVRENSLLCWLYVLFLQVDPAAMKHHYISLWPCRYRVEWDHQILLQPELWLL